MPILNRKRVILAKIESAYGSDAGPTAANGILVSKLDVTPLDADLVSRDLVRNFMGNGGQIIAGQKVTVSMEVELNNSGTAGAAPGMGPLLRACGFAEVLNAAAVTGTAQNGTTTSITLGASASAADGAYVGMPVTITSGTGAGQSGIIVSYSGSSKVATVVSPTVWATAPNNTSNYSIGASAAYKPISGSFESVTLYYQPQDAAGANSPLHKITGARGTFEIGMTAKAIPTVKFTLTGIYNAPTDAALITATYSSFKEPLPVNKTNTPAFSLFGFNAVANELQLTLGNDVNYRNLIGSESIQITDRKSTGSATIEAPTLTAMNYFAAAMALPMGNLLVTHGTTAGQIVSIASGGGLNVLNPSYSDMDNIVMMQVPFDLVANNGGDEICLSFY